MTEFCSVGGGATTGVSTATVLGGGGGVASTGWDGMRHLPSAFWAQTISGFTNEISLMTRCPPKRDEKRIRSRKVFAVRKSGDTPGWLCGIVIPVSFNPHQ